LKQQLAPKRRQLQELEDKKLESQRKRPKEDKSAKKEEVKSTKKEVDLDKPIDPCTL
jgi:hypothetical protein